MTYRIGEPAFIDPYNAVESEGIQVIAAVFDSLTVIDENGKPAPAAAESWETNEDATVWTFKLNPDAKFHDGTPVTAEDFVYAWNRIVGSPKNTPENPSGIAYHMVGVKGFDEVSTNGGKMEGVVALDDLSLEVTLTDSFADFAFVVAHPGFGPVPQASVDEDPEAFAEMPVGNGPFKMAEPWKHDEYIKVVRNDDYYGEKAFLDGVEFKIYKDDGAAYRDFQAGNLDFTVLPSGQIQLAVDEYGLSADGYTVEPGKQVLLGAAAANYYYTINNSDPVLKDIRVRQALSYAINRQAIADAVFEGTRAPATDFVPKGLLGAEDNAWADSKYDLEAAKQMLAEAGYPDGAGLPTIDIAYNTEDGSHAKIAELVRSDWEKLGIKTTASGTKFAQYIERMQSKEYQIGRASWGADYPIIDNFLYPQFTTDSPINWASYSNPEFDKLVTSARTKTDDDARIAAYQEANSIVAKDLPVIPIVWDRHRHVGSDRIQGLFYSNMGLASLEKVRIEE